MITIESLKDILIKSGADIDLKSINSEYTFKEIGLDSLDVFNFFSEIDDVFGYDIPDEDFEVLDTIGKLKNYLEIKTNG